MWRKRLPRDALDEEEAKRLKHVRRSGKHSHAARIPCFRVQGPIEPWAVQQCGKQQNDQQHLPRDSAFERLPARIKLAKQGSVHHHDILLGVLGGNIDH